MSNHYGWTPEQIQKVREKIRIKANYKCCFCNRDIRKISLAYSTHHIIPKRLLKENCWKEEYLVCICKDCHFKIERFNSKIFEFLKVRRKEDEN